ncbi:MAG: endo alpha-1,4 polygalactosaminidase [Elusimicrobia bacterium]|nr:endo alpha-1,4 polygalactosaminidase [Elusimicrobiota bacterium]
MTAGLILAALLAPAALGAGGPAPTPAPSAAPKAKKKAAAIPAAKPAPRARPAVAAAQKWICFYGGNISDRIWKDLDLAMVDPDNFQVPSTSGPVRLAYVSVGEVDERRAFWSSVKGRPYVIEPNPDWPSAHRVDLRSPEWRSLLHDRVISDALYKGYEGVMFDTLDTAEYFESSAPVKFAGSVDAAAAFIREVRAKNPTIAIVVNNGISIAEAVAPDIDGLLVEDLYTRCLPQYSECGPTPREHSFEKEKRLKEFVRKTGKPVFVLLYARLEEREKGWLKNAVRRSRENGFRPYVASPTLERYGRIDP